MIVIEKEELHQRIYDNLNTGSPDARLRPHGLKSREWTCKSVFHCLISYRTSIPPIATQDIHPPFGEQIRK